MKVFILCLSFANVCFLNAWKELLDPQYSFSHKSFITWRQLLAVGLDVIVLAVVLWIPLALVALSENRVAKRVMWCCILAGLTLPLNILRFSNQVPGILSGPVLRATLIRILLVILGGCCATILVWKWERLTAKTVSVIFMILAPLLLVNVASVAVRILTYAGRLPDKPLAHAIAQEPGAPHVLWFIFDEWDQSLTFDRRPARLELPELDRFRNQSFYADHALPPAGFTLLSVPSLVIGRTLFQSVPETPELMVTYRPHQLSVTLESQTTIFSEARDKEFNVGIVGSYLPYCRMFGSTTCEWQDESEYPNSLGEEMVQSARQQLGIVPLARRTVMRALGENRRQREVHLLAYRKLQNAVLRSIVDSRLNLVFVHWDIPHLPAIYDAGEDGFSVDSDSTYVDNLRLLDRTVMAVHLTLERAGLWDSSTILMTSDHPFRIAFWGRSRLAPLSLGSLPQTSEVPFLLKMAGQKQGVAYNAPMQTVIAKDLLLAIMKREITQPAQIAEWLEHNPPR